MTEPESSLPISDSLETTVLARVSCVSSIGNSDGEITEASWLAEIGVDSLALLELFVDIETQLNVQIPLTAMDPAAYETVGDIIRLVHQVRDQ